MEKYKKIYLIISILCTFLCSCSNIGIESKPWVNTPEAIKYYKNDFMSCKYDSRLVYLYSNSEKAGDSSVTFISFSKSEKSLAMVLKRGFSDSIDTNMSRESAESLFNGIFKIESNSTTTTIPKTDNTYAFSSTVNNEKYYGKILAIDDSSATIAVAHIFPNDSENSRKALLSAYNSIEYIDQPKPTTYDSKVDELDERAKKEAKTYKKIKSGNLFKKIQSLYPGFMELSSTSNGTYYITLNSNKKGAKKACTELINICETIYKKALKEKTGCVFNLQISENNIASLVIVKTDHIFSTLYGLDEKVEKSINSAYYKNKYFNDLDSTNQSNKRFEELDEKY